MIKQPANTCPVCWGPTLYCMRMDTTACPLGHVIRGGDRHFLAQLGKILPNTAHGALVYLKSAAVMQLLGPDRERTIEMISPAVYRLRPARLIEDVAEGEQCFL